MQKLRNTDPIDVGDLVRNVFLGSPEYNKIGLVTERIHYVQPKHPSRGSHPDEYNCIVLFDGVEKTVRAKWLQVISKNLEKEENNV